HQAYELKDYRSLPLLENIKELYKIEQNCKDLDFDAPLPVRQEQPQPIIDQIKSWLNDNPALSLESGLKRTNTPPKSRLGKAITYLTNQWDSLVEFLKDSKLPLDNGEVERAIRPVAIGRKNYLFAGSRRGAKNAAVIYSLLAGCALNDIKPDIYMKDILTKLVNNWPANRIDELLPHNWKELNQKEIISVSK
ncbi:transposase, partial [bacterium]|nr:transposase [bacterium]